MIKKVRLRIEEIRIVFRYCVGLALSVFNSRRHWVLLERGDDARDNGYHLYRYIKEKHPEQKVYYLINRSSVDYQKVEEDAVQFGSLKSYYLIASAQKLISTHYAAGLPIMSTRLFKFFGLHRKFFFLQHGIIKDALPMLYGKVAPMRKFICGAKPEYEFVKNTFGHGDDVVQYTGLARFDNLHATNVKRQILVMPTWRMYVKNEQGFLASEYYKCWQSFLGNKRLIRRLETENIQLVFYAHYEMQPYIKHFVSISKQVVIARFEEYDVQDLLKESAVLITDYSSVFFDFAYMRKPILYYQFDEDEFFSHHYQRGYFSYRDMGFGDVCVDEIELIERLMLICNNEMRLSEKYAKRIHGFFPLHDTDNCKRIYDTILKY